MDTEPDLGFRIRSYEREAAQTLQRKYGFALEDIQGARDGRPPLGRGPIQFWINGKRVSRAEFLRAEPRERPGNYRIGVTSLTPQEVFLCDLLFRIQALTDFAKNMDFGRVIEMGIHIEQIVTTQRRASFGGFARAKAIRKKTAERDARIQQVIRENPKANNSFIAQKLKTDSTYRNLIARNPKLSLSFHALRQKISQERKKVERVPNTTTRLKQPEAAIDVDDRFEAYACDGSDRPHSCAFDDT